MPKSDFFSGHEAYSDAIAENTDIVGSCTLSWTSFAYAHIVKLCASM